MPTSFTEPSVLRVCSAAPDPGPPQPISANLSVSLPAANALRSTDKPPSTEAPATAALVFLRKSRRLTGDSGFFSLGAFMLILWLTFRLGLVRSTASKIHG